MSCFFFFFASKSNWYINSFQQCLFKYFQCSFISQSSGLTVDGDIHSLDVCVDIIDSCALVCPCSLSGDRWDLQVLIIWCHVAYKGSDTQCEKSRQGHSGLMWHINSCSLNCCFHNVLLLGLWESNCHTGALGKSKKVLISIFVTMEIPLPLWKMIQNSAFRELILILANKEKSSCKAEKCSSQTEIKGSQQGLLILLCQDIKFAQFHVEEFSQSKYHFHQGLQSLVLKPTKILYFWGHFNTVINALLSTHSSSIICQTFHILLFCVPLKLQADRDYNWDNYKDGKIPALLFFYVSIWHAWQRHLTQHST